MPTTSLVPAGPDRLPSRKPRFGLALGGGGARGLAHIVALETLDDLGIRPAVISGTSIGAMLGAAYAAGMSGRLIRAHAEETLGQRYALVRQLIGVRARPVERLFNLLPMRAALLDGEAMLDLLMPSRLPATFDDLAIPLSIVATDFHAQERVVLRTGPLRRAIAASIALPVVFQPVAVDGRLLMDGGLVDPLPFGMLAGEVDFTIAIDVSGAAREPDSARHPGIIESLFSASQILQRSIIREQLRSQAPDIYADAASDAYGVLEFHRFREILAAAEPLRDRLRRQIERLLGSETVRALE